MIDKDLDYCLKQIEFQEKRINALKGVIEIAKKAMLDADENIKKAKEERQKIGHTFKELESKLGNENRILGEMRIHRHQLKMFKRILKNQHKTIDKENQ